MEISLPEREFRVHFNSSLSVCEADHMNKPFPSFYLLQVRQRLLVSVSWKYTEEPFHFDVRTGIPGR